MADSGVITAIVTVLVSAISAGAALLGQTFAVRATRGLPVLSPTAP
jgi:hypothetical protein